MGDICHLFATWVDLSSRIPYYLKQNEIWQYRLTVARNIRLRIDDDLCRACRRCPAARACKVRAIVHLDPDESPYLDVQRCNDCRVCMPACPFEAVVIAPAAL